jgi:hypothetical protein
MECEINEMKVLCGQSHVTDILSPGKRTVITVNETNLRE